VCRAEACSLSSVVVSHCVTSEAEPAPPPAALTSSLGPPLAAGGVYLTPSLPWAYCARSLPQRRIAPRYENRTAVVWGVGWNESAVGRLGEAGSAPG
jgi:hypothetical protein